MQHINSDFTMVSIHCCAYNHENYIRQCLEGFVMQKTNFIFEAIVHDDASTDNTAKIIKEYAQKYPHIIKPIFQKENQYSKCKENIDKAMWEQTNGKYIALCEGDDYWTDPYKLQKQVDILEKNIEFTLCCSNAVIKTKNEELDWTRYTNNQIIPTEDIIVGGGLFIQTASLIYRKEILKDYPECAKKCHVGDYPLQIFAALKGKVYWFSEKQVTYRFQTANSWTKEINSLPLEKLIKGWKSEVDMLIGLDEYSNKKYTNAFNSRLNQYIYNIYISHTEHISQLKQIFSDQNKLITINQKINIFLLQKRMYFLYKIFNKIYHFYITKS